MKINGKSFRPWISGGCHGVMHGFKPLLILRTRVNWESAIVKISLQLFAAEEKRKNLELINSPHDWMFSFGHCDKLMAGGMGLNEGLHFTAINQANSFDSALAACHRSANQPPRTYPFGYSPPAPSPEPIFLCAASCTSTSKSQTLAVDMLTLCSSVSATCRTRPLFIDNVLPFWKCGISQRTPCQSDRSRCTCCFFFLVFLFFQVYK